MNLQETISQGRPFDDPAEALGDLDSEGTASLVSAAGDIVLAMDGDGVIRDLAVSIADFPDIDDWIGRSWLETVTTESRPKVEELLTGTSPGERWRQVNHPHAEGEIPVRYRLISLEGGNRHIAIGRDIRPWAKLQQRLLQTQQSLERDYMRMRRTEARYRLLFDQGIDPRFIVVNGSWRIVEANARAHAVTGASRALSGRDFLALFPEEARADIAARLSTASDGQDLAPLETGLAHHSARVQLHASAFRQEGQTLLIVRLVMEGDGGQRSHAGAMALEAIEHLPDAFVMTDASLGIVTANAAFVEMAGAASAAALRGRSLGDYLGRPGIDLDLIRKHLDEHGFVRNAGTVARTGEDEEPVELSAVRTDSHGGHFGFVIRPVGRRVRDLPPASNEMPRSVEQLTELVGKLPLKEIVRESTDLIERMCIEAALSYTSDNRASAAEILGLSRQSLYSKLHRHGLGNLDSKEN